MTPSEALALITPHKLSPNGASITFNVGSLRDAVAALKVGRDDLDVGRDLMRAAWHEFNSIRASRGAPDGVSPEWWDKITEDLQTLLADDAKPWMLGAAKVLWDRAQQEALATADREERGLRGTLELAQEEIERVRAPVWRTMGSAPRDGTQVIVGHKFAVFSAWWSDAASGWINGVTDNDDEYDTYDPTHWMPLPAPPAAEEQPA